LKSCRTTHKFVEFYIEKALAQEKGVPSEEDSGPGKSTRSMLQGLTEQTDDIVDIRSQLLQGMMAAADTTSVLTSNALFLLSRHPSTWKQLHKLAKSGGPALLEFEALQSSKLLRNILFETLRIYPVFPSFGRQALRDTRLPTGGGPDGQSPIFAAAGTGLQINFFTLHRDTEVFGPNVEEFDPGRWDKINPDKWEFLPFGGGYKACMGQQKALIEASYILVRIAQSFDNLESRDDREWEGELKLTCRNANGCKVSLY